MCKTLGASVVQLSIVLIYLAYKSDIVAKQSNFLGEFIKGRKTVGAVAPSSKFLTKKMIAPIDFQKADIILELGPGNGVFTKAILERMKQTSKIFSFELNTAFYQHIFNNVDDKRLTLINDSAEKIDEYLEKHGIGKVDYIVSSLPFTVIPKEVKLTIIDKCVNQLKDDGMFIQFQYSLNAKKLLSLKFSQVKIDFSALNFPPAFVYKCKL
jgi:phospholipid N-methyltransferase